MLSDGLARQDKDVLLHDALLKNTALVSEIERATKEKDALRQQVLTLEDKTLAQQELTQDLQMRLAKSEEAVSFSDQVLALSREQVESLHVLREQLKEQETLVSVKEDQLAVARAEADRDTQELRRRLIAVTEHNHSLQTERKQDDSETEQLHAQVPPPPISALSVGRSVCGSALYHIAMSWCVARVSPASVIVASLRRCSLVAPPLRLPHTCSTRDRSTFMTLSCLCCLNPAAGKRAARAAGGLDRARAGALREEQPDA